MFAGFIVVAIVVSWLMYPFPMFETIGVERDSTSGRSRRHPQPSICVERAEHRDARRAERATTELASTTASRRDPDGRGRESLVPARTSRNWPRRRPSADASSRSQVSGSSIASNTSGSP
jgi:hypothetical protein